MAPNGSGREVGELPKFKCTYPDCKKRFDTEADMRYHKKNDPNHNYCKKCDIDCDDWDDLTQHKVDAMAPWLDERRRPPKEESPKHIVCEFCGEDFKSFGGRKRHRTQMHPADQNIECPGCKSIFTRAANLIAHLERGQCESITTHEFVGSVQHKHVLNEIMKEPDVFAANLQVNKAFDATVDKPGLVTDGTDHQDQEQGGVALIDQDDAAQKDSGYKPLEAEVNLIDMNLPLTRSALETWPRLSGQEPFHLQQSMRKISINSLGSSINDYEVPAGHCASNVTSRRGGRKVYTESYTSLGSPQAPSSAWEDDDAALESTTIATSPEPRAWTVRNTAQALFKDAKPTPPAGDWAAILQKREEEALANDSTNLFHVRFWDPASPDYNPDRFLHSVIGKYCCPFAGCGDTFDVPQDIEAHLHYTHLKTSYRCPACLKIFKSATALIAHSESTGKCRIKDSNNYKKLLDEVSGGFLRAKRLVEPSIYRPDKAVVKAGQPVNGVMSIEYKAKMPEQH